jgi:lipoprotein-anchoring transpeptidase ErfK/SrfK
MRRALITFTLILASGALAAPAASAQVPPPEERIRAGVTVSGVDVGNLTVPEATARLEQTLGPVLAQDIAVSAAGRTFPLKMSALKFKFRADKTALRALYAGRAAPQAPDGTLPPASATPSVAYRRKPVWRFARRTAAKVDKQARDARIRIKTYRITKVAGRKGRKLGVRALVAAIQATVPNPAAVRTIAGKVTVTTPRIRTRELAKAYPSVITIDQSSFRLRLFKRLKFVKGYGVAVGQAAYPTPNGRFALQSKQVDPVWTAPNSPWAGEMGGQSVSGGAPNNPLKARWMGVSGSVGIHGTGEPWSIGTRASHGCIRMTVPDVVDLFARVSVGTPVLIAP